MLFRVEQQQSQTAITVAQSTEQEIMSAACADIIMLTVNKQQQQSQTAITGAQSAVQATVSAACAEIIMLLRVEQQQSQTAITQEQ